MDGFISRRPQRSLLNEQAQKKTNTTVGHMRTDLRQTTAVHSGEDVDNEQLHSGADLKQNISESLQSIDTDATEQKQKKKQRRKNKRWAKIAGLVLGLIVLLVVGFLLFKAWQLGSKVFQGNLLGVFQQQELKMDAQGRSNVLILGSTDDMAGRDGASLTDSMMVLSVDQKKKDAYMFSIPRDLYVQYGMACAPGYAGKINAFYVCADDGDSQEAETARMDATKKLVGNIFGMDIQYVVHVNTVVIRDGVNAVGGITVNVESDDDRGVLDSTFDSMCTKASDLCPNGHFMQFKNGPNSMNGDQAMAFSQARGMGYLNYGLTGSNFAREKNQQLVLMALKEKAASTGTLTDLAKVTALMDTMGDNLRTNIDVKEVQTVMKLAVDIPATNIHRLSFVDEDAPLMTTSSAAVPGQSIVLPSAGLYDYSAIRAYLKKTIYATALSKENASVVVLNGTDTAGVAQREADILEELGLNVLHVGNASESASGTNKVYALVKEGEKPETRKKLAQIYKTTITQSAPSFEVPDDTAFVVVVGASAEQE